MSYQCKSPVLMLVFNRPDVTAQVFKAIRAAKPTQLYVACDGPRPDRVGEAVIVEQVREIVTAVDWDCEIRTLFREENLGCSKAVNGAITWFFENVEAGIILEDDTVPDHSFFPYCEELLVRYADDQRIGMISGNNHLPEYKFTDSYIFSKFKWTWGWATWRRAWLNQDLEVGMMSSPQSSSVLKNMGYKDCSERLWNRNLNKLETKSVNTWDYQWFFALGAQNQLSIIPRYNLVANVGFGTEGATHCAGNASERYLKTHSLECPLKHPQYIVPDYHHEIVYESILVGDGRGFGRYIPTRLRSYIKQFLLALKK